MAHCMVVSNMQSYIICSLCQIKLHDSATLTVYYKAGNINWLELNVVVDPGSQDRYCKSISGFKFGGSVRDRHMCMCE